MIKQTLIDEIVTNIKELFNKVGVYHITTDTLGNDKLLLNGDKTYGTNSPESLPNPQEGQLYFHVLTNSDLKEPVVDTEV